MSRPALDELLRRLGGRARADAPLAELTTYRVGGRAAGAFVVEGEADVQLFSSAIDGLDVDVLVLGNGSNLLVADGGWPGVIVSLGPAFSGIELPGPDVVAGAACRLPVLGRRTAAAGWSGLEWAVGVPGSVGGAVRMNAGGHGSDTATTLVDADIVDLRTGRRACRSPQELELGFRRSNVRADELVLFARHRLTPGVPERSEAEMDEIVAWRRANQPGGRNAGSVFVNPPGDSAGRLVEAAGCKGLRHRSAQVSTRHANFIQADRDGMADDVAALIQIVREQVRLRCGVLLDTEVRMVGFRPEASMSTGERDS